MKIKTYLVSALALSAFACASAPELPSILGELNTDLASTVRIYGDTTNLFLTDYYPMASQIDSIVGVGVKVVKSASDWATFTVIAASDAPRLAYLRLYKGGSGVDVALVVRSARTFSLASQSVDGKNLFLSASANPTKVIAMWQNIVLPDSYLTIREKEIKVTIPNIADTFERSFLRVIAADSAGISGDILMPLAKGAPVTDAAQLNRHDKQTQIIYSLMVDRFYNGNKGNDKKLNSPEVLDIVDYQGGDIAGITEKINSGFFTDLGISTIWVSPVTQNPYDAWGQNEKPRTKFSGYHGYWPIYVTALDKRFSTEAEFKEMIAAAHAKNINIILDYVANHMHIDSPTLNEHPDWTTPARTPDGRENMALWDEFRLTTWFDKHIPSLDLERKEIYEPLTDSALYWLANYDLDGFRHDATKHIPEVFWRTLTKKSKERFPNRTIYQVGETYGSPELINSYVKSGMLDAQFDFNVYDATIWALADTSGNMENVMNTLKNSLDVYGYHNLMGYITGNHDRGRFISYAGGAMSLHQDAKAAGWNRKVTVGDTVTAYARLSMLHALMLTIAGVPTIYQGDDYGIPGGNDPDNRHMMVFDNYNAKEQAVRDNLAALAQMRRSSMPLLYGDFVPLYSSKSAIMFARIYLGKVVVVGINNATQKVDIRATLPVYPYSEINMSIEPLSFKVM